MRSIWSGSLSFGLVNIPVTLHPATRSKQISFNMLNKVDKHPVSYQKIDRFDNKPLEKEDIVKGFEFEKGKYVVLEDKDFEAAEIKTGKTIDISDFIKIDHVDPVFFQKSYYLAPTASSRKAYKILAESLEKEERAALAKVVIRNKQQMVTIRPKNKVLLMETMFFADEIVQPAQISEALEGIETNEAELSMAQNLIRTLATDFKPEKYEDEYRKNLLSVIEEKIKGREVSVPEVEERAEVVDIMGALKESVERIEQQKKAAEQRKTA